MIINYFEEFDCDLLQKELNEVIKCYESLMSILGPSVVENEKLQPWLANFFKFKLWGSPFSISTGQKSTPRSPRHSVAILNVPAVYNLSAFRLKRTAANIGHVCDDQPPSMRVPRVSKRIEMFDISLEQTLLYLHSSIVAISKIHELKFELMPQPPYSKGLARSDYYQFPNLKEWLVSNRLKSNEEVIGAAKYFKELDKSTFKTVYPIDRVKKAQLVRLGFKAFLFNGELKNNNSHCRNPPCDLQRHFLKNVNLSPFPLVLAAGTFNLLKSFEKLQRYRQGKKMKDVVTWFYKSISIKSSDKSGDSLYLYLSCIIAYLTAFSCGVSFSWTSPVIPRFKSIENPFGHEVSTTQLALIAAFLPLGAVSGPLLAGLASDKIGRKKTMMVLAVPMIAGFCILAFGRIVELYYLARFLIGLGVGSTFAILPMYIAEITEGRNRGKFGCFLGIFITLGLFYPFSVGPHLTLQVYAMSCTIPLVVFFIIFGLFMTESPHYLLVRGRKKDAEEALMKLRNKCVNHIQTDISEIMLSIEENSQSKGGFKELFTAPVAREAMLISAGLVLLQELSGIHPMMAYLKPIFESSTKTISPDVATLIFGISQISSNFITALVVEKTGRRILYMVSSAGCGICCAVLGIYFLLKHLSYDMESVFWMPIVCMVGYMIFFSMGLGPLAWNVVGEIFPSNVKGVGSGLTVCISFLASFVVVTIFPILAKAASMAAPFWMYTVVTVLGMFFIYYKVPETKGMSLAEIQQTLKKTHRNNSPVAENNV
ncbi:facilitated trehalose transporter Tret1-like [Cylas formicarius]|uniref:facilitated trehalose transporter Tret1-like n=1 Tax=Cylas formicarius TaxID=197179 RepID=UPI0029583D90|nr:facilitated trehalose transporter Tret1-like [Cylas formicarius]